MSDPQSVGDPKPGHAATKVGNADVIASGMDPEMQHYAVQCANEAIAKHPDHKMAIAQYLMTHFEEKYGPPWHCIVSDGHLGFYVRYDAKNHIYFAVGSMTIFLFKSQC